MKKWLVVSIAIFVTTFNLNTFACGPTPQKVVKEITIKGDANKIWEVVNRFDAMALWHPDIQGTELLEKIGEEGKQETHRLIKFKSGVTLEEKRRNTPDAQMKLDYQMTDGEFLVSNYRDVMQIREGITKDETIVTWIGRFNNKANTLAAPAGQDNDTAIAAVSSFYQNGLQGLKTYIER